MNERMMRACGVLTATVFSLALTGAAYAAAPGKQISDDYRMTVDGREVEVISVPAPEHGTHIHGDVMDRQPYSFAPFATTGTVEVSVRSGAFDLSRTQVLPRSKRVEGSWVEGSGEYKFKLTPPMTVVLEPKGRHRALVVAANKEEGVGSRCRCRAEGKVKSFGPGYHRAGRIALGDGETLYLAPGAWVEGWIQAQGKDITVCGGGVLSGACWDWRKGPRDENGKCLAGVMTRFSGENITVKDVTLFSAWSWTLVFDSVTNALVDNVKILCGRVINDDGIDVCRGKDVVLRNSFVRCQDDCIAPKWWCENLVCTNMTLWTDAANAFRVGWECEPGASGLVFRNHLYKDIDVLHLSLDRNRATDLWANCALYIQPSNDQVMSDLVFDDIRFYDCVPGNIFLNVKTLPIYPHGGGRYNPKTAGFLKGLTLRNINLPYSRGGMDILLSSHDDAHPIEGVRFENVTGYGPVAKKGRVDFTGGRKEFRKPATCETQVICLEKGRYLGWPTVCRRKSGELLVVFSGDRDAHVCPWGKVQLIRSTDDGKTWSKPETIQNGILDDRDAGLVELPDGTLVLNWFTSVAFEVWNRGCDGARRDAAAEYGRHYQSLPHEQVRAALGAWASRSTDGGKTWSKPVRTNGQLPHNFTLLKDGRLIGVTRKMSGEGQVLADEPGFAQIGHHIFCEASSDGGRTWQVLTELVPEKGIKMQDLHEPHLAELPDGRLVAQVRWHGNPMKGSWGMGLVQAESSDGGKTWTKMAPTKIVGFPPHLIPLKDGRLLTVYAKRINGICGEYACLSSDGGRTWDTENEILLCPFANGDLGYPSSVQLADGSILTVYYQPPKVGEPTAVMATHWTLPK